MTPYFICGLCRNVIVITTQYKYFSVYCDPCMTVLRKVKMANPLEKDDIINIARLFVDLLNDRECSPEQSIEVVKYLNNILEKR